MKTKIGILGSCVSRDAFNSYFVPNYKDFFEIVISANRVSMISIMQKPLHLNDLNMLKILPDNKQNKARTNFIIYDLNKQIIQELLEKDIDYLIIDNYLEVTMGILYFNNFIITNNYWDLPATQFYESLTDKFILTIMKYPNEYFYLWSKYCNLFFSFLKKYCPNCKIILNKGRVIDKIIKEDGTTYINPEFTKKAKIINPLLEKLDNYILQHFNINYIPFDFENTTLDENHIWGIGPVHYSKNYYISLSKKILKIIKDNNEQKKNKFKIQNSYDDLKIFYEKTERINLESKLFISNLIINQLKEGDNFIKVDSNSNLIKYCTGRIDIKNYGSEKNSIEIIENSDKNASLLYPHWFINSTGRGLVIESYKYQSILKLNVLKMGN